MFLATFACGALAGRLCVGLGVPFLIYRNAVSVLTSYLCFILLMWGYVRAIRADRAYLLSAATESVDMGGKSGGIWTWLEDWSVDFDGWILLLAILAMMALIGIWIGVEGPALLVDEAFAAAMAAGLAGRTQFLLEQSWLRRVVQRTIWPVAAYLLFSSIVMGYADVHCPGRLKFSQVVRECVMAQGKK